MNKKTSSLFNSLDLKKIVAKDTRKEKLLEFCEQIIVKNLPGDQMLQLGELVLLAYVLFQVTIFTYHEIEQNLKQIDKKSTPDSLLHHKITKDFLNSLKAIDTTNIEIFTDSCLQVSIEEKMNKSDKSVLNEFLCKNTKLTKIQ